MARDAKPDEALVETTGGCVFGFLGALTRRLANQARYWFAVMNKGGNRSAPASRVE